MSRKLVILMLCLGVLPLQALAEEQQAAAAAVVEQKAQAPVEVGNKLCPVSGEKVGQMGEVVKYEYNGKIYNLCCGMCVKDFKKDPAKYSKIADDEVAAAVKSGS